MSRILRSDGNYMNKFHVIPIGGCAHLIPRYWYELCAVTALGTRRAIVNLIPAAEEASPLAGF